MSQTLSEKGLNLLSIFNTADLPSDIITHLVNENFTPNNYTQLILMGHGGRNLWASLPNQYHMQDHPIDNFTINTIKQWFLDEYPNANYRINYPITQSIDLIALGKLAGWHHESPFLVGVNNAWGPWFAYRAVILANTNFEITKSTNTPSPCSTCSSKPCIKNCPADACDNGTLDLNKCINYRKSTHSLCSKTCIARISCPIATKHSYSEQQINYHYSVSLETIKEHDIKASYEQL
jgi:epoxyqueuosine reductase